MHASRRANIVPLLTAVLSLLVTTDGASAAGVPRPSPTPSETVLATGATHLGELGTDVVSQKLLRADGTTAERVVEMQGLRARTRSLAAAMDANDELAFLRRGAATEPLARLVRDSPPGAVVPVVLWSSRPMPWIRKELLDSAPDQADKQLSRLLDAREAAVGELLLLLALYDLEGERLQDLPAVRAVLPTEVVVPVASEPAVGRMGLAPTRFIPTSTTYSVTTGAEEVHGWGWTGAGEKIGVVLASKPSSTACLSFSNRRWLTSSASVEAKVAHGAVKSTTTSTCTPADFGVAPSAAIYSADPLSSGGCDGVCWALGQGAVVVAAGWAEASSLVDEAVIDEHDAMLDSIVRLPPYPVIVTSAGNSNDVSGAACSADPAAGYVQNHLFNGLVVGGLDEAGTSSFEDDSLYACSSWRNPASPHGDRELPHLVAPAVDVEAGGGGPSTGTSIAAAITAGVASLVLQSNGGLANWPEATRAILMASAHGDFDGQQGFGCADESSGCGKDGHGLISASRAVEVAGTRAQGEPGQAAVPVGHDYGTMTFATDFMDGFFHRGADPVRWRFSVAPGAMTRVVLTWSSTGVPGPGFSDVPDADLDLWVVDAQGQLVVTSSSWDRVVESVLVSNPGATSAVFEARVRLWSSVSAMTYFGLAFQPTVDAHTCPGQCAIGGACVTDGSVKPGAPCMWCDAATNPSGWSPRDGVDCDDQDGCTVGDTCSQGSCVGQDYPPCHDPDHGLVCLVSGSEGDTVECPIRFARGSESSPTPVNLQVRLGLDPRLSVVTLCDGIHPTLGIPWTIPSPFTVLQDGHSVLMEPGDLASWTDHAFVILAHLQDIYQPITDAWVDGAGAIHQDPTVFSLSIELLDDIPIGAPAEVRVSDVWSTDWGSIVLPVSVDSLLLMTEP